MVVIVLPLLTLWVDLASSPPQGSRMNDVVGDRFTKIDELYVFGDSLSDVGQVFQASGGMYPPDPPYFRGRYSNGRVWIEYLADRLQISQNKVHHFAYGGATTGVIQVRGDALTYSANFVPNVLDQVQMAIESNQDVRANEQSSEQLNEQSSPQPEQILRSNALYVIWAGANDYLQGSSIPENAVRSLTKAMDTLIERGARRFLIANLPDLGQLPATRNTANSEQLSDLSQTHNQMLERSLTSLQLHSEVEIALLDVQQLYEEVTTAPEAFDFTNATNAYLISTQQACDTPDRFLFWDGIHPTTAAHRRLEAAAFRVLQETFSSVL
jgi:phospholipase/lecithinase/hemolysin